MLSAFGLGVLAQSSLLAAGLLVCWVKVPRRVVGVLAGFGAGALLAAISFDLVLEAEDLDFWELGLWMLVGVAVFLVGDRVVERRYGSTGLPVSASFFAAVLVSNVPQAIAPSAELVADGWGPRRLGRLWLLVVLACGVAAVFGYLAGDLGGSAGSRWAAFAADGLLGMLTNSLMPFAYEHGGELAGVGTVIGFCLSLLTS